MSIAANQRFSSVFRMKTYYKVNEIEETEVVISTILWSIAIIKLQENYFLFKLFLLNVNSVVSSLKGEVICE